MHAWIFPSAGRPEGREQATERVHHPFAVMLKQQAGNNDPAEGVWKRTTAVGERKAVAKRRLQSESSKTSL